MTERPRQATPPSAGETISVSEFKAKCLALVDRVKRTGRPLLITRRGEPMAAVVPPEPPAPEGSWLGSAAGTGRIVGDLVAPAVRPGEWKALGS